MLKVRSGSLFFAAILSVLVAVVQSQSESEGKAFISEKDKAIKDFKHKETVAQWAYIVKEGDEDNYYNTMDELEAQEEQILDEIKQYKWQGLQDPSVKRMFQKYTHEQKILSDEKADKLSQCILDMENTYASITVCAYQDPKKCDMGMIDVAEIFATSQDPDELIYYWKEVHKFGSLTRQNFTDYVSLYNEAARLNGFQSAAEWWISEFETSDFEQQLAKVWEEVKPLYLQIHAYVRRKLMDIYPNLVSPKKPIPANLLGDVMAQGWSNIEYLTRPFPDKEEIDVSKALVDQKYTPLKMFQLADKYLQSLNMTGMNAQFWKNSVFEDFADRFGDCTPTSYNFYDGADYRITYCTTVTQEDLMIVFNEMGYMQYIVQSGKQPYIFQKPPTGLHEAFSNTLPLLISSPKYLNRIGLIKNTVEDKQAEINRLYKLALDKIVHIPYAYLLDTFRYAVFRGTIPLQDLECNYWALREKLQGVDPPVKRSEQDFDAGVEYHIVANVEYVKYLMPIVMKFQFLESVCKLSGQYAANDPSKKLDNCDAYQSAAAGQALTNMLNLGSSKPWTEVIKVLTGQPKISASGIMNYFAPLLQFLTEENKKNGEVIGWDSNLDLFCNQKQKTALIAKKSTKP